MSDTRPRIRKIYQKLDHSQSDNCSKHRNQQQEECAFHITNAFRESDLQKLDNLRQKIPLDVSRPTCPRRFLTEKHLLDEEGDGNDDDDDRRQHMEDGWVGALIDDTIQGDWDLPFRCLPWYRYLEYTEPGGHMAKHSDGSNVHPKTGARSVATMMIYLSTCRTGGETTLYRKKERGKKKTKHRGLLAQTAQTDDADSNANILESIRPTYNTVLIFPHSWQHSGDPVIEDPKIALRVDLAWDPDSSSDS
mmetsp:Transcript_44581/g.93563  ORF Transcript_44581/g.93563 Transcript_44581/m.93563 type:complete len:249 (+) Transcript_44581:212-958(+)|eukprot:CAMPEP_0183732706 /NCGR_PEP_ID=MMETSP0737-20130205/39135_1 /TAXON_ID=385413 /ORGANISM="Thalassiosira miniscula, Strain CCMP1093" /LENGTH=248 /DNA_ID=CAMNT_0025965787 /DNA_START=136 /DNA_END=882 /DNA_ORIENTATION=+